MEVKQDPNDRAAIMNREAEQPTIPGLPVHGYKPQSQDAVDVVNRNKELEETILRVCDSLREVSEVDERWLAIGVTHLEQAFMAINRAVFKPGRVELPTDRHKEDDNFDRKKVDG